MQHKYWDIAIAVACLSKDPVRKVGAVIFDNDYDIITSGYNGFPRGIPDTPELLDDVDKKLKLTVHAEQNAISNAARLGVSTKGSKMMITLCPCLDCAKAIIQAGIKTVICPNTPVEEPRSKWAAGGKEALELFALADIKVLFTEREYD